MFDFFYPNSDFTWGLFPENPCAGDRIEQPIFLELRKVSEIFSHNFLSSAAAMSSLCVSHLPPNFSFSEMLIRLISNLILISTIVDRLALDFLCPSTLSLCFNLIAGACERHAPPPAYLFRFSPIALHTLPYLTLFSYLHLFPQAFHTDTHTQFLAHSQTPDRTCPAD